MTVAERLEKLGIVLPSPPRPAAAYVPVKRHGSLVFVSGQGPIREGKPVYVGKVGGELTLEQGYEAARLAALNCLAVLHEALGTLEVVQDIINVKGFVNSAPGFTDQPKVVNGASELLEAVFGERGRHTRTAVGVNELPFGIPVEVEMLVAVVM